MVSIQAWWSAVRNGASQRLSEIVATIFVFFLNSVFLTALFQNQTVFWNVCEESIIKLLQHRVEADGEDLAGRGF